MAQKIPVIQVLSRNNYTVQHIVSLPSANPLPALSPSSLRIRSTVLSLTANNLSYARIGHLIGWYDIHPLPPSIPAEFSDPKKYGRISAWGYGTVVESTVPKIPDGSYVWGYLPIGTLPVDVEVEVDGEVEGQFLVKSKHREKTLPLYNRYMFYPPGDTSVSAAKSKENQGWDSLFQLLFECGYLFNRVTFAWHPKESMSPSGKDDGWTFEKGKMDEKSVVLSFAASGKTALALAYNLKYGRPAGEQARSIIGIGSSASKAFTEGTGLYDEVLLYDADSGNLDEVLGLKPDSKVFVCEFGSRGGAADRWAAKLRQSHSNVIQVRIGGEVVADAPETTTAKIISRSKTEEGVYAINASAIRIQAMDTLGRQKYFDGFLKEWQTVKEKGLANGLQLSWGDGMEDLGKGWDRLCEGKVGPAEGLVFSL